MSPLPPSENDSLGVLAFHDALELGLVPQRLHRGLVQRPQLVRRQGVELDLDESPVLSLERRRAGVRTGRGCRVA
jgi:hypothetical protein